MIKDPVKIIKRFLIVVSILSLLTLFINIGTIAQLFGLALAIVILSTLFDIAMLIIGIRFSTLIKDRPSFVTKFLWINVVWALLNSLYAYKIGTSKIGAFVFVVIYI